MKFNKRSAIHEYDALTAEYEALLSSAATKKAISYLRLMINRCKASAVHVRALLVLKDIHRYYDYENPSELTEDQRESK